ncbi:MAG TPA: M50 family metallopeptidase [bacterium]|nr:M50 family metallopeptidase [bacterium]
MEETTSHTTEAGPAGPPQSSPNGRSFFRSNGLILALVAVSIALDFFPFTGMILLPFEFFTTFIHESGHAIASLIMGESVSRIVINPDTSGYMQHTVSGGRLAQGFIASAGYLGAALFAGILIIMSGRRNLARVILAVIGIGFAVAIVFYVRDFFTFAVSGGLCAVLLLLAFKGGTWLNYIVINFLAVQCALNAVSDALTLVRLSMGATRSRYSLGHSDADTVAQLFFLPAVVWSILWVIIAVAILYYALKISARFQASAKPPQPSAG